MAKDALGHGSDAGASRVNKMFRLNSHTHEVVSPSGDVVARLRIGKHNGLAFDEPGMGEIQYSGGPSLHDSFAMQAYSAKGGSFPAETVPLHYLSGKDFAGHTIRPRK